jgi:hypothetical protein
MFPGPARSAPPLRQHWARTLCYRSVHRARVVYSVCGVCGGACVCVRCVVPVEVEDVVSGIKEEPVALTPENESHLVDQQVQRERLAIL